MIGAAANREQLDWQIGGWPRPRRDHRHLAAALSQQRAEADAVLLEAAGRGQPEDDEGDATPADFRFRHLAPTHLVLIGERRLDAGRLRPPAQQLGGLVDAGERL